MGDILETRTYSRVQAVAFRKTNERFGGLSNMAPGFPLEVAGIHIRTSEALYQACRFPHLPDVQKLILNEPSPMTAKMRSKPYRKDSRPDWDAVRVPIMKWCLRVKLAQHWLSFGDLLVATGDRPIVEDSRKDDYWGAKTVSDETLSGQNVLGRLLMELREKLRSAPGALKIVEPLPLHAFLLLGRPIPRIFADTSGYTKPVERPRPALDAAYPRLSAEIAADRRDTGKSGMAANKLTGAAQTGLDEALKLEAVYYSAPVPRDLATLTVLGAVFDKVYFPGVYLPMSGFDQAELDKEIARIIEATRDQPRPYENLVGILSFIRHAKTLEGFCVFSESGDRPFRNDIPSRMVDDLYKAIHGPHPEGWQPMFSNNCSKAMPGSEEHISYPGEYHYLAGALLHAAATGVPLLNDMPGLPVPMISDEAGGDKAKQLSAMLAVECVRLALPELPLLRPDDLMEFRSDNGESLRAFRRSMLRYAGDLNGKLVKENPRDVAETARFFVNTEIVPVLDELRAKMNAPARSWYKRAVDFGRVLPRVVPSFFTMNPATIIGSILTNYAGQFFTELSAVGEKQEVLKKSGLYYLLQLQAYQSEHRLK